MSDEICCCSVCMPMPRTTVPAPTVSNGPITRMAVAMLEEQTDDDIDVDVAVMAWAARFLFSNPFRP